MSIGYERHGFSTVIRMDDGKANAMQLRWCEEIGAAMERAESDDSRAVILTGREGFFSAGLDLKVLPGLPPDELQQTIDLFTTTMRRIFLFPKPLLAASSGHCIAGGMLLYLAADVRLAASRPEGARYVLNEALTGIPLGSGMLAICRSAIPVERIAELVMHGRTLSAAETLERGITHELLPDPSALLARAFARAEALRDVDPDAYRINKLLLREGAWDSAAATAANLAGGTGGNVFARLRR